MMKSFIKSPFLVSFDSHFDIAKTSISAEDYGGVPGKKDCKEQLGKVVAEIDVLQKMMYAHGHYSILMIFQAMDAGGKDSTIRAVTKGLNSAGCQLHSFKKPSASELEHDFLWRTNKALPERGRIGSFNRSHYEEVLVVRVHPSIISS